MKQLLSFILGAFLLITLAGCDSKSTDPEPQPDPKGGMFIQSTPSGAQIWLDGTNSNKVTPDSIMNLDPKNYNVTLKLNDYKDTTIVVDVIANDKRSRVVVLTSDKEVVKYGPVRLWETANTTADQPSGLILKNGEASGIGSAATNRLLVDIYYSSSGYLVRSADAASGLTRETFFKVSTSTNLNDGVQSSIKDATWIKEMGDREANYVFLYDNDGHYSKIKIVAFGGGIGTEPAWVEVEWYFNKVKDDRRF